MVIISDTTPLISLLKIGRLDLLEKMYKTVIIPKAVYEELTTNTHFPEEAETIRACPFLEVRTISDTNSVINLRETTGLDLGESEAIVLSESMNAKLLMMDEVRGRAVAKAHGLSIIGVVGILATAYKIHLLTAEDIKDCVTKLKQNRRHIGENLLNALLNEAK